MEGSQLGYLRFFSVSLCLGGGSYCEKQQTQSNRDTKFAYGNSDQDTTAS
jgi:hypothetical protein